MNVYLFVSTNCNEIIKAYFFKSIRLNTQYALSSNETFTLQTIVCVSQFICLSFIVSELSIAQLYRGHVRHVSVLRLPNRVKIRSLYQQKIKSGWC